MSHVTPTVIFDNTYKNLAKNGTSCFLNELANSKYKKVTGS